MLVGGLERSKSQTKILVAKSEIIMQVKKEKSILNQSEMNEDEIKSGIMDAVWNSIDGITKPDQLIAYLTGQKTKIANFESLVADILSIIDIELASFGANVTSMLSKGLASSGNHPDAATTTVKRDKFLSILNQLRPFLGDELLKERLEIETLEAVKLIVKKETFNQKYIKIKTRLFYKQQKFNLLREESEGYSKLITELGQSNLNSKILENIQSLIGCFNLDPNRVLDIILESFENAPHMHRSFIDLLNNYKAEDETICQIIGFKFQSLTQQETTLQKSRHVEGGVTEGKNQLDAQTQQDFNFFQTQHVQFKNSQLYTATAYLLKYNMIDLDLLMPHLYPTELQTSQFYKEEFELSRKYAKKLTMVSLSETTESNITSTSNKSSSKSSSSDYSPIDYQQQHQQNQHEELKRVMHVQLNRLENQRVSMVRALIEIEDYKTALRMVEKLPPWYLATYPDVSLEICRAIDSHVVEPIYRKCNSLSKCLKEKYVRANSKQSNSDLSLDELLGVFVECVVPILSAMGPGLSYHTILFTKLIRICIAFLQIHHLSTTDLTDLSAEASVPSQTASNNCSGTSTPTTQTRESTSKALPRETSAEMLGRLTGNELAFYNQIYTMMNDVLMPSLSMIQMNPCLAQELWSLLKMFPYEMRYYLYNNWRQFSYKHFPQLIRAKAECQEKIKYLLKRLTKENVKIHGRQIGKLSHNNPIIVCDFILTQIQRYDNFILPIVDSLKFLTPLSYDVLSYCTIIAISDAEKDKMKIDSTCVSTWLRSVAAFCSLAFKKYPIELTAIIQYVINQLKNKKSYDLLILQEIVQKMCGIEVLSEVNDLQLEAMAGGDILRQEAGYFNPIRNIKKCATRLKEALADHGLILPLCILLSQQRDYIVYTDQSSAEKQHLKLTGSLYDQCQDSLVQFSQFLSSTLTTEEYIHIFPKIDEMVNEYHMSADVAFFLSRPMYAHHIQSRYDELRRMDRSVKSVEKLSKTQRYLESIDYVMQPVIDLVQTLHSPKIWEDMSALFYTTFWTLSMNDCFVPTSAYDKQKAILKHKLTLLDDNMELTTSKKKKEKEKLLIMFDKLTEEENKQRDHVQHVKARFEKEKEFWFPHKSKTKNDTITVFLQLCIFSRCLFTQIDAYYCAKFIQIIHSLKTPNFSTIICYDRIFSDISYSIASLTDNEARKYGRFILGLLETVMSWHADPAIFETECASFPGFLTVFRNALNTPGTSTPQTGANKQEQLDYENFRHVCHKWHYKLTKCFIVCLESEEYVQMRNSLIILTKILPQYPRLTGFCSALEKRIEKIKLTEKDRKQDIATLAMVYLGQLKQRKAHMVDESKFHLKEVALPAVPAKMIVKEEKLIIKKENISVSSKDTNGSSRPSSTPITATPTTVNSNSKITSSSIATREDRDSKSNHISSSRDTHRGENREKTEKVTTNGDSTNGKSSKRSTTTSTNGSPSKTTTTDSVPKTKSSRSNSPTPTRKTKISEFSPTSSVSSDEWPNSSPKNPKEEKPSHSRSSSPKSYATAHSTDKSHDKSSKRQKSSTTEPAAAAAAVVATPNGTSSAKEKYEKITMSGLNGNNSNGGSSIRDNNTEDKYISKSSRTDRTDRSDRSDRSDKLESGAKTEKKDHRKREHSIDEHALDSERKRSKSDESKKEKEKKSSGSSSSLPSSQSSDTARSDSARKRSSKKHDSVIKEDEVSGSNGRESSKHRSDNNDSRRTEDARKSSSSLNTRK